jgi:hypothetical protein
MAKFRKKPVVIEAVRYTGKNAAEVLDFGNFEFVVTQIEGERIVQIATLEGIMNAKEGDWIIKDVKGEFYPCKPDIFEATYEAVAA